MIGPFRGKYRFLSNFWWEPSGQTSEHRFQAAKTTDPDARRLILAAATPGEAKLLGSRAGMAELSKTLGRPIELRADWEEIAVDVMRWSLERKFRHPVLAKLLLSTGEAELVELNGWHDSKWGVCACSSCANAGENRLGKLLMERRAILRSGL